MNNRLGQPGQAAEVLLQDLSEQPGVDPDSVRTLRQVIANSAVLGRQIDAAVSRGVLRRFARLGSARGAEGAYDPADRAVMISEDVLTDPAESAFVLGHEVQHALNSPTIDQSVSRLYASLRRNADTTLDYTAAIGNAIRDNRWDEAPANLAGWNALADFARRPGKPLRLRAILDAALTETRGFVEGSDPLRLVPGLTPNPDLTFSFSPENIETMARRFFDTRPRNQLSSFDYTNYYGAWAVSVAVEEHNRWQPGQLMRIDLARLGLSEKSMTQNGLQLNVSQQRYVDGSTEPPTYGVLRNTSAAPGRSPLMPQTELSRCFEAARLAAAGVTRSLPGSRPVRVRCAPVAHRPRATDPLGR